MARTSTRDWPCSVARTVDLLGDQWVLLILRESFYGARRFDQFVDNLGVNRATLTARLTSMVEAGLLETRPLPDHAGRREYLLTDMGHDTLPVLLAVMRFGDDWLAGEDGPPVDVVDRETGNVVRPLVVDETTGQPVPRRIRVRPRTAAATAAAESRT